MRQLAVLRLESPPGDHRYPTRQHGRLDRPRAGVASLFRRSRGLDGRGRRAAASGRAERIGTHEMTPEPAEFEEVLGFWFPALPSVDRAAVARQGEWWFRGGADAAIADRFPPLLERAARGELDGWSREPRSRLALIIVLDQFSRTIHRGTARAYPQDPKALALAREGIDDGHYAVLATAWEKAFFFLPLGHAEDLATVEASVRFAEELVLEAPPAVRWWFEFSAEQARGQRDVIARFGRHPHRNEALGRQSTPEEREYLRAGEFVHTRPLPRVQATPRKKP